MTNPIKNLTETLREAFSKAPKMPLRRHRDDDYWDRIEIVADGGPGVPRPVRLIARIVPRFKTSGLSGDEWRISAHLDVTREGQSEPILHRTFHRMRGLLEHAAHFLYSQVNGILSHPHAKMTVTRKGVVLMEQRFPFFGDAAMGMGWHIVTCNEGRPDTKWHHLTDAEEREHCQQVGCGETPANFYHLTKLQVGADRLLLEPEYDFSGQYTWYCPRHTQRGDAGLEDCDKNLVLIAGSGTSSPLARDESPAVLGGSITISWTEGDK